MNQKFEITLERFKQDWESLYKGEINQVAEGKIRSNIATICLKVYRGLVRSITGSKDHPLIKPHLDKGYSDLTLLRLGYLDLLNNMQCGWMKDLVQQHVHEDPEWKKSVIKISSMDQIYATFNVTMNELENAS